MFNNPKNGQSSSGSKPNFTAEVVVSLAALPLRFLGIDPGVSSNEFCRDGTLGHSSGVSG